MIVFPFRTSLLGSEHRITFCQNIYGDILMLSYIHCAAKMTISSKKALGPALLLASTSVPALGQDTPAPAVPAEAAASVDSSAMRAEVAGIEEEISEAEAELAGYEGGLIATLVQARIETLKLTRAILENQAAAAGGGAVTAITVPVAAPDEARAAEILRDIEAQLKIIEEAEAEAAGAGGLVGALAVSRALTEKLTLTQLRAAWMAARYGTIVPVAVTAAPQVASTAPAADRPEDAAEPDSRASLPEWADPDHPEIDYTKSIFSAMAGQGYQIRGWWGLEETRAEIDNSPLVFARNVSAVPDTGFMPTTPGLFFRCREGESSVIYDADTYISGNFRSDTLPTSIRIDDRPAETQQWSKLTTSKGSGLFGVRAEAMMRRLLDAEKAFFRIEDGGQRYDASFDLAGIQPVVEAVAGACGFSLLELTRDDYRAIQTMLNAAGFDTGAPDEVWGNGSARAMREWQEENGLPATGAPDRTSLEAMGITLAAE